MDELETIRARLAIEELNAAFVYALDRSLVDVLPDFFTEDALYTHGERRSQGRAAIHDLFAGRASGQGRTSRHIYSGLRIEIGEGGHATGSCVCLTFAADGPPPIASAEPLLVADFVDRYRLCADGKWRIEERHIHRIFVAAGNAGPVGLAKPSSGGRA